MTRRTWRLLLLLALCGAISCGRTANRPLQDGDLIFQISLSGQSRAIQAATGSRYSHEGLIFHRDGQPFVLEAAESVQATPLEEFAARGRDGHFVVKRLRHADRRLTPEARERMWEVARALEGRPYDLAFAWSDERIYCLELVWKIYERGAGVRIGRLQKLRDFDLTSPPVQAKLRERYGASLPLEETVISPGDMFDSPELELVARF
ncbi:MAG: YiiX family permuted papain-like enzyme [Candidatus Delongbacteria bacterium]